jgi:membrane carboxypeptidase/penicillin-binding protein PbpC
MSRLTSLKCVARAPRILVAVLFIIVLCVTTTWWMARDAELRYHHLLSPTMHDRTGVPIIVKENSKGHYALPLTNTPPGFSTLLTQKEDRFFYYHLGVNPASTLRAFSALFTNGKAGGSSTLTQQLAKNLLHNESQRTIANKLLETAYAFSLELFNTKEDILLMYANTVYLGNQVQGFETASIAYFGKPLAETTSQEQIALLATLSHPSTRNPWREENTLYARALAQRLTGEELFFAPDATKQYSFQDDSSFELTTAGIHCLHSSCATTIDSSVTAIIREIVQEHVTASWERNVTHGAVVVIEPTTGSLLALVGTPDPHRTAHGHQINMALAPRPIGSTVKPFIYGKGFAEGLRPYTIVEDREYKYPIATGFPLYPKNYDGQFRGQVTLHKALSNSLNVPTVKTLEYIGLTNFYAFLNNQMHFKPIQDYDSYQYGIALGGLEMDLLTLTHYFSLFPNQGTLLPLQVLADSTETFNLPPQSDISAPQVVLTPAHAGLVHTILSDRFTGVDQFGLKNNLNLPITEYGVKTGTSRDYHDSWVVGYTSDFVVGVWLGNAENTPLEQISGQGGAGAVWQAVVEYLLTTPYATNHTIPTDQLERFVIDGNEEFGLRDDVVAAHRNLLEDGNLIMSLHQGDTFEFKTGTVIPLRARQTVTWNVNGSFFANAQETTFAPTTPGTYEITAQANALDQFERIMIEVTEPR